MKICFNLWLALLCFLALSFSACTGGRHFEVVGEGPPRNGVPQSLIVTKAPQVATLHFPAGRYQLYASDDTGYYYRSLQPVREHVPGGSLPLKGGVYVTKARPVIARPYVYRTGALTHVGKLKPGTYEFQDEQAAAPERHASVFP